MKTLYERSRHGIHNLTRPEVVADPHRYIDAIADLGPLFFDEVGKVWVSSGYAESKAILGDYQRFSSTRTHEPAELLARGFGEAAEVAEIVRDQVLFSDPPDHTRIRELMRGKFTKAAVDGFDQRMKEAVDTALGALPRHGILDLVEDFAAKFPPFLVAQLLGMTGRERDLTRWADGYERLIGSLSSLPNLRDREIVPTLRDAMEAFKTEVRQRRRRTDEDLIADMTSGMLGDDELSPEERQLAEHVIAANCLVLVAGGYQTLTQLITTALVHLARYPDQQRLLRDEPELIDGAIDEFMRLDGSSQYVARRATADVRIGGRDIAAGDTVLVHLGAANLDSSVFEDPKTLNIVRRGPKHLGFGLGRHYCVGAPMAERMARWAILGFLERFDDYDIAEQSDAIVWGRHANTRCPAHARLRVGNPPKKADAAPRPANFTAEFDRHRQVEEWNNTKAPLGPHSGWHQLVEYWARLTPDALAIEDEHGSHSYRQLDQRANALAAVLREHDVQPGSVVCAFVDRSADLAVVALGIAKAGGAFLLADPDSPIERLRSMAHDSRAALIIASPGTKSRLDSVDLPTTVLVPDTRRELVSPPKTGANVGTMAYVVFTSGTTGRPKGIAIDHEGVLNLHVAQRHVLRITPGDRVLQFLSPNFDGCFFEILLALGAGAALVFAAGSRLQVGPPLVRTLRDQRVTTVLLTPSVWAALPGADLPDLRIACAVGERLPAPVAARWSAPGRRFLNLYGPAETAIWATWHEVSDPSTPPPIGRPIANKRVYVMNDALDPLGIGESGELCIGGVGVGRYLSQPDLMERRFALDPFGTRTGELMYRTGDVGRRLLDGSLEYLGRHDRQVKIRGQRIELEEIERVLETAPGVRECAVTALEGKLTATIVPVGERIDEAEVRGYLADRLHSGMLPAALVTVANLPRTAVGKREQPLVSPVIPAVTAHGDVDPDVADRVASLATWRLTRIFAASLDTEPQQVRVETDFFSAGGDSLALSELIARTEEELGVELDIDELLAKPTPDALATSVLGEAAASQELVESLRAHAREDAGGDTPEVDDGDPMPLRTLATSDSPTGTVLLVHGTMDSAGAFSRLAAKTEGWTVLGYDRRGWGSARAPGQDGLTFDDHVADLVRTLRTLDKPVVAGHSYGGLVAVCAAARYPDLVGAVVAYEPPLRWFPWWPADEEWQRVVARARPDGPAAVAAALVAAVTGRPAIAKGDDDGAMAADGAAVLTEMNDGRVDVPTFEPAAVEVPLIVAAGTKSHAHHREVAKRLADLAPHGTFVDVAGAKHTGHVTHPGQFARLIEQALEAATEVGERERPVAAPADSTVAAHGSGIDRRVASLATWRLSRIFAACLEREPHDVRTDTDFFSAGGDARALSELVARAGAEFGVDVDMDGLRAEPTLAALASSVLGAVATGRELVDSLREHARENADKSFPDVDGGDPMPLEKLAESDSPKGTVLLVHGTMDDASAFKRLAAKFKGWTVLAYDRRGWGGARAPGQNALTFNDHVADLIRTLRTLDKPVVAGHSYGGLVAVCAAARYPDLVSAVVAYEPPLRWFPWWPADEEWQRVVSEKQSEGPAAVATALVSAVTGRPAMAKGDDDGAMAADGAAVLTEMNDRGVDVTSFEPAAVEVPLFVAAGGKSLAHHREVSERLADLAPRGTFVDVPGARHIAHITHPGPFARLVEQAAEAAAAAEAMR
jgi:amino acid adenylation domain-containing protein